MKVRMSHFWLNCFRQVSVMLGSVLNHWPKNRNTHLYNAMPYNHKADHFHFPIDKLTTSNILLFFLQTHLWWLWPTNSISTSSPPSNFPVNGVPPFLRVSLSSSFVVIWSLRFAFLPSRCADFLASHLDFHGPPYFWTVEMAICQRVGIFL